MGRLKFLRQLPQAIFPSGHQHAVHAPGGQLPGKLGSDARGGPGNKTPVIGVGFQHDAKIVVGMGEATRKEEWPGPKG